MAIETCEDFLAISSMAGGFRKQSLAYCSHVELTVDLLKILRCCRNVGTSPARAFGIRVLGKSVTSLA